MKPVLLVALFIFIPNLRAAQSGASISATAHAGAANQLMQNRRYAEAAEEFRQALSLNPNDDTLRVQYATCLFLEESNDEARKQFEILLRRLGDRPGLMYFLGQLDLRANNYASAVRRLEPLAGNSSFPKVPYYLGLAYLSVGENAKALNYLQTAAVLNPRDSEVHYRLARLYSMAGRSDDAGSEYKLYNEVLEEKQIAEQEGHDCMDALKTQPIEKARTVCKPLASSQDVRKMIFAGQLYLGARAFDDALAPLQQAAKLDPKSFDASYSLGATLYGLRRYQEAVPPLENAVALNPRYFDGLNLLAKTYHLLGNDAAALPILERAHSLNPSDHAVGAVLERMRANAGVKH